MTNKIDLFPVSEMKSISLKAWPIILALPLVNLIAVLVLRDHAGPFWMWSNLDPDYFYLLDSLNMVSFEWSRLFYHPGTPVQVLGTLLIKLQHPLTSADQITNLVLASPEIYLSQIHTALVLINTTALVFVGVCAYLVFGDLLAVTLIQMGPFISKLCIKWMTHVAPEPLLISVVLVLVGFTLLALRPGQLEANRNRYAVLFGLIAGFGMATKITSIGIYFLPLLLLWNYRSLLVYGFVGIGAFIFFTLPAAGSYADMIAHVNHISVGSSEIDVVKKAFISFAEYPSQLIRVSSRPAFFGVLLAGIGTLIYLAVQSKRLNKPYPITGKLLAGLCIAEIAQALIVAKHPSGHYMIPVLTLSTLGMALLYRIWIDQRQSRNVSLRPAQIVFLLLFLGLVGAQTKAALKLDAQFKSREQIARSVDDNKFAQCARINFWSAASPSYAFQLGNDMIGNPFAEKLAEMRPENDFWFEVLRGEFRDWKGIKDIKDISNAYPCIYARGLYPAQIKADFDRFIPSRTFETVCSPRSGHETIFTSGVNCEGHLK